MIARLLNICFLIFCVFLSLYAQQNTAATDTAGVNVEVDTTANQQRYEFEEFILETIRIEAVIERPSVTLIPKKAETQVGEVKLERRSFLNELNAKPKEFSKYHEKLESGKRIKKIKKVLAKEK